MRLNNFRILNAAPGAKPYKLTDGDGMYLLIQPSGAKWWRFDYRFAGGRRTLSLGVYPDVSLAQARTRLQEVRQQLAAGNDPSVVRREKKRAARVAAITTFESIAREWLGKQDHVFAARTSAKAKQLFEGLVFPWVGKTPIIAIDAPMLLEVLRRIETRGAIETAHRVRQRCSQVFRYAVATGRAQRDPAADLKGALAPVKTTHRPAIVDPAAFGDLLADIEALEGSLVVKCALRLAPLVFLRPGELRSARWGDIDLDAAEWRIPAHLMKMTEPHIVPLSRQAVGILSELRPLTGRGQFVFPSIRTPARTMSENTINVALRRLGYAKDVMCGHGFRASASTILNELGHSSDVIERQLSHVHGNKVRAAYNRALYLPERRQMMQDWADHMDRLRRGREKRSRRAQAPVVVGLAG